MADGQGFVLPVKIVQSNNFNQLATDVESTINKIKSAGGKVLSATGTQAEANDVALFVGNQIKELNKAKADLRQNLKGGFGDPGAIRTEIRALDGLIRKLKEVTEAARTPIGAAKSIAPNTAVKTEENRQRRALLEQQLAERQAAERRQADEARALAQARIMGRQLTENQKAAGGARIAQMENVRRAEKDAARRTQATGLSAFQSSTDLAAAYREKKAREAAAAAGAGAGGRKPPTVPPAAAAPPPPPERPRPNPNTNLSNQVWEDVRRGDRAGKPSKEMYDEAEQRIRDERTARLQNIAYLDKLSTNYRGILDTTVLEKAVRAEAMGALKRQSANNKRLQDAIANERVAGAEERRQQAKRFDVSTEAGYARADALARANVRERRSDLGVRNLEIGRTLGFNKDSGKYEGKGLAAEGLNKYLEGVLKRQISIREAQLNLNLGASKEMAEEKLLLAKLNRQVAEQVRKGTKIKEVAKDRSDEASTNRRISIEQTKIDLASGAAKEMAKEKLILAELNRAVEKEVRARTDQAEIARENLRKARFEREQRRQDRLVEKPKDRQAIAQEELDVAARKRDIDSRVRLGTDVGAVAQDQADKAATTRRIALERQRIELTSGAIREMAKEKAGRAEINRLVDSEVRALTDKVAVARETLDKARDERRQRRITRELETPTDRRGIAQEQIDEATRARDIARRVRAGTDVNEVAGEQAEIAAQNRRIALAQLQLDLQSGAVAEMAREKVNRARLNRAVEQEVRAQTNKAQVAQENLAKQRNERVQKAFDRALETPADRQGIAIDQIGEAARKREIDALVRKGTNVGAVAQEQADVSAQSRRIAIERLKLELANGSAVEMAKQKVLLANLNRAVEQEVRTQTNKAQVAQENLAKQRNERVQRAFDRALETPADRQGIATDKLGEAARQRDIDRRVREGTDVDAIALENADTARLRTRQQRADLAAVTPADRQAAAIAATESRLATAQQKLANLAELRTAAGQRTLAVEQQLATEMAELKATEARQKSTNLRLISATAQEANAREEQAARVSLARAGVKTDDIAKLEGAELLARAAVVKKAQADNQRAAIARATGEEEIRAAARMRLEESKLRVAIATRERQYIKEAVASGEVGRGNFFQRLQFGLNPRSTKLPEENLGFKQFVGDKFQRTVGYAASGAILGGGIAAVSGLFRDASQLEQTFVSLRGQMEGIGQSNAFPRVRDQVRDIAAETGQASNEVAKFFARELGLDNDPAQAYLDTASAMKLATVTGLDYKTLEVSLVPIQKAFSVSAEEIGDNVVSMSEKFGIGADDLTQFLGKTAAVAKAAGLEFGELTALGGNLANSLGKPIDSASESINKSFSQIEQNKEKIFAILAANPGTEGAIPKMIEAFARGETGDALKSLLEASQNFTATQKDAILHNVVSRREAEEFNALIQNAPAILADMATAENKTGDASGKLQRRFTDLKDTVAVTGKQIAAAFESLGETLFRSGLSDIIVTVGNALKLVATAGGALLAVFGKINESTKIMGNGVLATFAQIVGGALILNRIFGAVTFAFKKAAGASTESGAADGAAVGPKTANANATKRQAAAETELAGARKASQAGAATGTVAGAPYYASGGKAAADATTKEAAKRYAFQAEQDAAAASRAGLIASQTARIQGSAPPATALDRVAQRKLAAEAAERTRLAGLRASLDAKAARGEGAYPVTDAARRAALRQQLDAKAAAEKAAATRAGVAAESAVPVSPLPPAWITARNVQAQRDIGAKLAKENPQFFRMEKSPPGVSSGQITSGLLTQRFLKGQAGREEALEGAARKTAAVEKLKQIQATRAAEASAASTAATTEATAAQAAVTAAARKQAQAKIAEATKLASDAGAIQRRSLLTGMPIDPSSTLYGRWRGRSDAAYAARREVFDAKYAAQADDGTLKNAGFLRRSVSGGKFLRSASVDARMAATGQQTGASGGAIALLALAGAAAVKTAYDGQKENIDSEMDKLRAAVQKQDKANLQKMADYKTDFWGRVAATVFGQPLAEEVIDTEITYQESTEARKKFGLKYKMPEEAKELDSTKAKTAAGYQTLYAAQGRAMTPEQLASLQAELSSTPELMKFAEENLGLSIEDVIPKEGEEPKTDDRNILLNADGTPSYEVKRQVRQLSAEDIPKIINAANAVDQTSKDVPEPQKAAANRVLTAVDKFSKGSETPEMKQLIADLAQSGNVAGAIEKSGKSTAEYFSTLETVNGQQFTSIEELNRQYQSGAISQAEFLSRQERALSYLRQEGKALTGPEGEKARQVVLDAEKVKRDLLDQSALGLLDIQNKFANVGSLTPKAAALANRISTVKGVSRQAQIAQLPTLIDDSISAQEEEIKRIADPVERGEAMKRGVQLDPFVKEVFYKQAFNQSQQALDASQSLAGGTFGMTVEQFQDWVSKVAASQGITPEQAVLDDLDQQIEKWKKMKEEYDKLPDGAGAFGSFAAQQKIDQLEGAKRVASAGLGGLPGAPTGEVSAEKQAAIDIDTAAAVRKNRFKVLAAEYSGNSIESAILAQNEADANLADVMKKRALGEATDEDVAEARANAATTRKNRQDAERALAKLRANRAVVEANGDPLAELAGRRAAAEEERAALQALGKKADKGAVEQNEQDLIAIDQQQARAQLDVIRSGMSITDALIERNPLQAAQAALRRAEFEEKNAIGLAAKQEAEANRIKAQHGLEDAMSRSAEARANLAIAIATANDDPVEAARIAAKEAQRKLDEAVARGVKDDEALAPLRAASISANRELVRTQVQDQIDTIDYMQSMGQISTSQALASLRAVLATVKVGSKEYEQLSQKIRTMTQSAQADLQFNLPTTLGLPTLYESRRANQNLQQGIGYQDNRNVTVAISVNGAQDPSAVAAQVASALNSSLRGGATYTAAVPVGAS